MARGMSNAEARLFQLKQLTENIQNFMKNLGDTKGQRHEQTMLKQLLSGQPGTGNRPGEDAKPGFFGALGRQFDPNSYDGQLTDMEKQFKMQPLIEAIQAGKFKREQKGKENLETFKTDEQIRLEKEKAKLKKPGKISANEEVTQWVKEHGEDFTGAPAGYKTIWDKQKKAEQTEEKKYKDELWVKFRKMQAWKPGQYLKDRANPYQMTEEELDVIGQGQDEEAANTWEQIQRKIAAGVELTDGEEQIRQDRQKDVDPNEDEKAFWTAMLKSGDDDMKKMAMVELAKFAGLNLDIKKGWFSDEITTAKTDKGETPTGKVDLGTLSDEEILKGAGLKK